MNLEQPSKLLSFDAFIAALDGAAFGVINDHIHQGDFTSIVPFVREEMLAVCHLDEPAVLEVRKDNELISPFKFKGRFLMLSPHFFGKGYELYIDGKPACALNLDYWCSKVGDTEILLH